MLNIITREYRLKHFGGVLRFALQFLPADNLKGFKMQPTTKSQYQGNKEQGGTTVCSFTSAALEFHECP
jgi:hypothetical protein